MEQGTCIASLQAYEPVALPHSCAHLPSASVYKQAHTGHTQQHGWSHGRVCEEAPAPVFHTHNTRECPCLPEPPPAKHTEPHL